MDCAAYMPEDFIRACDQIEELLTMHPWMYNFIEKKAMSVLQDIATHKFEGKALIELMRDELITAMAVGIRMGEEKVLMWQNQYVDNIIDFPGHEIKEEKGDGE